jgi:hypothetical protein
MPFSWRLSSRFSLAFLFLAVVCDDENEIFMLKKKEERRGEDLS